MKTKIICLASIAFLTLPVFAHEGVKNDAVKQRMQLMTVIKDTMAKIGAMARGLDPFTEESAANAKQTLLLALGPSRLTSITSSGFPASIATAARVLIMSSHCY